MPKYRVTAPDGKTYDVTPPDGTPQEEIQAQLDALVGTGSEAKNPLLNPTDRPPAGGGAIQDTLTAIAGSPRAGVEPPVIGPGGRLRTAPKPMVGLTATEASRAEDAMYRSALADLASAAPAQAMLPAKGILGAIRQAGGAGLAGAGAHLALDAVQRTMDPAEDRTFRDMVADAAEKGAGITAADLGFRGAAGVVHRLAHPFGAPGRKAAVRVVRDLLDQEHVPYTPGEVSNHSALQMIQRIADETAVGSKKEAITDRYKFLYQKFQDVLGSTLDYFSPRGSRLATGEAVRRAVNMPLKGGGAEPPYPGHKGTYQFFEEELGRKAFGTVDRMAQKSGAMLDIRSLSPELKAIFDETAKVRAVTAADDFFSDIPLVASLKERMAGFREALANASKPSPANQSGGVVSPQLRAQLEQKYFMIPFEQARKIKTNMGRASIKEAKGGRIATEDAAMAKRVGKILDRQLDDVANKSGFGAEWASAKQNYRDGLTLWEKSALPAMLVKDPAKLIASIPKNSAGVDDWVALKRGLLTYGPYGKGAWETARRQFIDDMIYPTEGIADLTGLKERMLSVHPDVVKTVFDDVLGKAVWRRTEALAEAMSRYRNLNPLGDVGGSRLLEKQINDYVMSGLTLPVGATPNIGRAAQSRAVYYFWRALQKVGLGKITRMIAYNPKATEFFLDGLSNGVAGQWGAASSKFRASVSAAMDMNAIREIKAEAQAMREEEDALLNSLTQRGLAGRRIGIAPAQGQPPRQGAGPGQ